MKYSIIGLFLIISSVLTAQEIREDGLVYLNGEKFNGTFNEHYEDGTTLKSTMPVRNGQPHGKSYIYYQNGKIKEIRSYKNAQKSGKWLKYNEAGLLVSKACYKNNLKHGNWKVWDDTGILRYDLNYANGEKTGTWKMYDEKGALTESKKY